jgi:hypothetical protein
MMEDGYKEFSVVEHENVENNKKRQLKSEGIASLIFFIIGVIGLIFPIPFFDFLTNMGMSLALGCLMMALVDYFVRNVEDLILILGRIIAGFGGYGLGALILMGFGLMLADPFLYNVIFVIALITFITLAIWTRYNQ